MRAAARSLGVATFLFIAAADVCLGQSMWDVLRPYIDPAFCKGNPADGRCDRTKTIGAQLLLKCDTRDEADRAYCHGSLDSMAHFAVTNVPEWKCVPKEPLHPEQLRLLFVREAHQHPEVLHLPAENLLFYAVAKAFPCPSFR
jgi:Ssp1 endopeptidase immunity protein Rap1a